jgi:Cof subfamily protein (haloacid dehalogenase superfamily)
MIKIIACDLDGTLLSDDHITISDENISAIKLAKEKGVLFCAATGRTLGVIPKMLTESGLVDYYIVSNGAKVADAKTGKTVFSTPMPEQKWHEVYNVLRDCNSVFEVYCNYKSYMDEDLFERFSSSAIPVNFTELLKNYIFPVKDMFKELKGETVEKISVLRTPAENCEKLMQILNGIKDITLCSSLPGNIEINSLGTNKGFALKKLCETLGINANETAAFGDSGNDIQMLQYAGFSYAMFRPNHEHILKAAKFPAPSNTENGVAVILNDLLR